MRQVQLTGPLEVGRDSPPSDVVLACRRLGFHAPLDVRRCRIGRFLAEKDGIVGSHLSE